jgi:hypothetical protein
MYLSVRLGMFFFWYTLASISDAVAGQHGITPVSISDHLTTVVRQSLGCRHHGMQP